MEKLKKYVVLSFIFATLLFFGGIYLGYTLQGKQINNANDELNNIDEELNQMETMVLMNSVNKNLTCTYLEGSIGVVYKDLEKVRLQVVSMEKDIKLRNSDEYNALVAKLINMRVKYWLLGEAVRKNCDPNLSTVLFFYSVNKKCIDCDVMGVELADVSSKCNVVIAPIPVDSKVDIANMLAKYYNVTSDDTPVLIINQNQVIKGLIPESNLTKILCHS